MRIAVFGSSGRTGRLLVHRALERRHEVIAHTRSPKYPDASHAGLEIVRGEISDTRSVERAIRQADAVISVLGPMENKPTFQVSSGMDHILKAMREQGVERLVVSAGAGVRVEQDEPGVLHAFIQLLVKSLSRWVYEDMVRTVAAVRNSSLAWTVVRVPMLTDGEPAGIVRVGYVGKGVGARLTRADLAIFLLDVVESGQYIHKAPAISN